MTDNNKLMWLQVSQAAASAIGNVISTRAQGKANIAHNNALLAQLGKSLNEINLQRAQTIQKTNAALFNIDVAKGQTQSQVQLQAAASGTMGASVKDAVSTVNTVYDRQTANAYAQYQSQMEAYRLSILKAGDDTANSMVGTTKVDMGLAVLGSVANTLGQAAANAASGKDGSSGDTSSDESAPAPVTAAVGSDPIPVSKSTPTVQDYNYDLWGNQSSGTGTQSYSSWKSYLG